MSIPTLRIGLPVNNGAACLPEGIDALSRCEHRLNGRTYGTVTLNSDRT
jgi:hypothetical protein